MKTETSVWLHPRPPPRFGRGSRRGRGRRGGDRGRHGRDHHRADALQEAGVPRRAAGGRPARGRRRAATRPRRSPPSTGSSTTRLRSELRRRRRPPRYGAANQAALAWMAGRVKPPGHRLRLPPPALLRLPRRRGERPPPTPNRRPDAAPAAGLPATLVRRHRCPIRSPPRSASTDQAEFQRPQVPGRARPSRFAAGPSSSTRTPSQVDADERCPVKRPAARGSPTRSSWPPTTRSWTGRWPSRALLPQRSYALAVPDRSHTARGHVPERRLAHPLDPFRAGGGEERLLVGGEGHKTGRGRGHRAALRALERLRPRALGRASPSSTAGPPRTAPPSTSVPSDRPRHAPHDPIQMATGFDKWGITGRHRGGDDPRPTGCWSARTRGPSSSTRAASSRARRSSTLAEENAKVGLHFIGDRLKHRGTRPIEDLAPGEGDIVPPRRREGRRPPPRRRHARRRLPPCTPSGLPGQLEHRRAQLGLPVPRLVLQPRGRGAPRPRRAPAGDQADPPPPPPPPPSD